MWSIRRGVEDLFGQHWRLTESTVVMKMTKYIACFRVHAFLSALAIACSASPTSAQVSEPEELPAPNANLAEPQRTRGEGTISILEGAPLQRSAAKAVDAPPQDGMIEPDSTAKAPIPNQVPPAPKPPSEEEQEGKLESILDPTGQYEILLQGPVHEAFGVPTEQSAKSILVDIAPPPPIAEERPAEVPEGNNVQWVGGYWMWEADRKDFIWISGMYREVPPGRTWVSGSWQQFGEKYQWVRGYWGVIGKARQAFLPPPPAPLQVDPTLPAPNENSFWMPGQWNYQDEQYAWQDGYWTPQYQDWIWQPSCYVETPRGHVYVSGYWDYEPTVRGTPYASVYLPPSLFQAANFRFSPRYRIGNSSALLLQLFVRNGYPGYYYGDLYGNDFLGLGYQPWYVGPSALGLPTMLSYYQWKYAQDGISFTRSLTRYNDLILGQPAVVTKRSVSLSPGAALLTSPLPQPYLDFSFDSLVRRSIAVGPSGIALSPGVVTNPRVATPNVTASIPTPLGQINIAGPGAGLVPPGFAGPGIIPTIRRGPGGIPIPGIAPAVRSGTSVRFGSPTIIGTSPSARSPYTRSPSTSGSRSSGSSRTTTSGLDKMRKEFPSGRVQQSILESVRPKSSPAANQQRSQGTIGSGPSSTGNDRRSSFLPSTGRSFLTPPVRTSGIRSKSTRDPVTGNPLSSRIAVPSSRTTSRLSPGLSSSTLRSRIGSPITTAPRTLTPQINSSRTLTPSINSSRTTTLKSRLGKPATSPARSLTPQINSSRSTTIRPSNIGRKRGR